jgi:hypothetical protein
MLDGIAKVFRKDNKVVFVGVQNHCGNLAKIVDSFDDKFTGNKELLKDAASKHDLWKSETLKPSVITEGKGGLFWGHGSEFPSYLVSKDFDEIEFDKQTRVNNYPNYYILNLIRLHHSGFSTYNLYNNVDFIYESGNVKENITSFIKDWYALKTADWIDSSLMNSIFNAEEVYSLVDMGLMSEVDLGKISDNEYRVIPDGYVNGDLELSYHYLETDITTVKDIIKNKSVIAQRLELNRYFIESEKDSIEVTIYGC